MERLTWVDEDGTVLFQNPNQFPEDVAFTITELAKNEEYDFLERIAERLANREVAADYYKLKYEKKCAELAAERQKHRWIPVEEKLPKTDMKVQAIIKHHKWIADYDSDWVPEEEKTVHPEWTEICEAIYKNGEFTFRCIEDDCFAETAYVSPENNITKPVSEILKWRPIACAEYDGWIPAEERLPNESGTYIVSAKENDFEHVTFCKWQTRYKRWDLTGSRAYWKIIAWRPLPAPYEPEKGDTAE